MSSSLSGDYRGVYYLSIPCGEATYTMVYEKDGFETVRETFHSKRFRMTETFRIRPMAYMMPLSCNTELSTDLTMYSRRGYATSSANTNDVVWNARISRTFLKTGIIFAVDGFDILNLLSNISQVVNSQGCVETYNNSLPSYVMAHMICRFNKPLQEVIVVYSNSKSTGQWSEP